MPPFGPVEEIQIGENGVAVPPDAHWQGPSHLIGVEGLFPFSVGRPAHFPPRIGGHPQLRIHPGHRHLRGADAGGGQDALLGDAKGVRIEGGPLVDALRLGHYPVGAHLPRARHLGGNHHQVVQSQIAVFVQQHPELCGSGRLPGGQHPAHCLPIAHNASSSIRQSRSAHSSSPSR